MARTVQCLIMEDRQVALVTGASRGIGRSTAAELAGSGFDLVLTARSVNGGAVFAGSRIGDPIAGVALAGGLDEVAAECRQLGARVAEVALDLTSRASVDSAADAALAAFGRVDVVVDNAVYQGPGLNDAALDVPVELVDLALRANALHPLVLIRRLLPQMIQRGDGVVIHLTSGAVALDPRHAGAWGVGYAMSKAAAHKIIGVLHAEVGSSGIRCYNLNPGHVMSEVGRLRAAAGGYEPTGQSPDIPAATIAWLVAGSDEARALAGTEVVARRRDHR
jgi:NAD(P)-dependent dehydrogenase (short-subunit alcohol dehydrogenase family)